MYSSESQLALFDSLFLPLESDQERIDNIRMSEVSRMRAKTYKAGEMVQVSIFPFWNTQQKRAPKSKPSRAAQKRRNDERARDNFVLYANNNFSSKDLILTLGYANQPALLEDVRRDVENYIKRVKYHRPKNLPPLKYMYVIEGDGVNKQFHVHILISGMDRDKLEKLWTGGDYPQTRRLRTDVRRGLTGLSFYITKSEEDLKRRWGHSRNLTLPAPSIADKKMSKRQAQKAALNKDDAIAWFRKNYPGYDLDIDSLEIKYSQFVAGVYVYARLYKSKPEKFFRRRP